MKFEITQLSGFSSTFPGTVWRTLADPDRPVLYLEVRDPRERKVTFSALNVQNNQWLWKEVAFDEPWWISLAAAAGDILLLTVYTDTDNPDKQSLIAYDVNAQQLIWWYNGFTLKSVSAAHVMGVDHKFPGVETLLDLFTGKPVRNVDFHLGDSQNFPVIRPFQYEEGTAHFETVRQFLLTRTARIPAARVEYLEWEGLIFLSVFVNDNGLANYLYAFDSSGNTLLEETLGVNLKGVGLDTFFIYSGHLIFVKNKNELRGYKIL